MFNSSGDYSATYITGNKHLDHAFSNFGNACTNCGQYYNGVSLPYGVVLGGYQGHPRMDNGDGFDHRQILMDIKVPYSVPVPGITGLDVNQLVKIQNVPQIISGKYLVVSNTGLLGYFDYGTISQNNSTALSSDIKDEIYFRNIPTMDSNKILTLDDFGKIGYSIASHLTNFAFSQSVSGTKGLLLQNTIKARRMTIKAEDASAYYVLVINSEGIVGKRPLTDIL